ncbi:MAG: TlpA family protein disulfide reductase [Rhodanobacter sp.]|nr:MAG: TlpA family protein disulfide reductase [Rhodanobacter sp.]
MSIGPLLLSTAVLALLFGVIAGMAAAGFLRRRGHADAGNALFMALGGGLLLARLGYIVRWWPQYVQQPASMLNIRDGGFSVLAGLLGLLLSGLLIGWRRAPLRRPLALGLLVGVSAWGFATLTANQLIEASHPALPNLVLHDLAGHDVAIRAWRGKPTVINLWATWCPPCRREMPVLVAAQRRLPAIRFVFADQGESAAAVKHFLKIEGLAPTHVLIDDGMQLSQHYAARGYPTTLFLDAHGHLRDMHIGELSRATLAERLQRIAPPADPGSG